MPHIIVKLYPGRPREVLDRLAERSQRMLWRSRGARERRCRWF